MAIKPIRNVTKNITPNGSNFILLDDGTSMGKATLSTSVKAVADGLIDTAIDGLNLGTASQSAVEDFATAEQGLLADNAVQPGDLSAVATSGDYSDLDNRPTLGTAAAADSSDFATADQGAKADAAIPASEIGSTVQGYSPRLNSLAEAADGTTGQVVGRAADGSLQFQAAGAGDMLAANDLSDVSDAVLAAGNLGLIKRDSVSALVADEVLAYSAATGKTAVIEGQIIEAQGFRYEVASSGASDAHVTTAGGVKLYAIPSNGVIYPEMLGAVRDGSTAVTTLLQKANDIAAAVGAELRSAGSDGAYYLTNDVHLTVPTSITCPIIIKNDAFADIFIDPPSGYAPDLLDFGDLSGLTERSTKITGLPSDAAGRYLWIESNEILTERNNPPSNDPYLKNAAVYIGDTSGGITPPLDMTFNADDGTNPYDITVKLWPRIGRMQVNLAKIEYQGAGSGGASRGQVIITRDNVSLKIGDVEVPSATPGYTFISVQANGAIIDAPPLVGFSMPGYGYGLSLGLSCNTVINGGSGGNCRHDVTGRHASNVTLNDLIAGVLDSHWGNNYVLNNCWFNTVFYNGYDLAIHGGGCFGQYAVQNREDVFLCKGRLIVDGGFTMGKDCVSLLRGNAGAFTYTENRRMFDRITIRDIECLSAGDIALVQYLASSGFVLGPPDMIDIDGVRAPNASSLIGVNWPLGTSPGLTVPARMRVANLKTSSIVYPINVNTDFPAASTRAIEMIIENCGNNVRLRAHPNAIDSCKIIECGVTWLYQYITSAARGIVELIGGTLSPGAAHTLAAKVGARGVTFLSGSHTVPSGYAYSIGNRAVSGATNLPALEYYVSADYIRNAALTGWAAMTGTATKSAIATYTAGTAGTTYTQADVQGLMDGLQALARRFKALDDALRAAGLLQS